MANDEEFSGTSYTLDYGLAKDKMFYVFVAYVSAMIIGIIYVIWRLRGYNKPDLSFKQILEKEARRKRMEKEADDDATKETEANSEGAVRKRITKTRKENDQKPTKSSSSTSIANGKVDRSDDDSEEDLDSKKSAGKIGTKKLRKLQEKAERKKFAEEMELERQERKQMREESERMREAEEERQREIEKEKV